MRFSVAALHCLLRLTALSRKTYVASGLPTKAADGDGDFASFSVESVRAHPHAPTAVSVVVAPNGAVIHARGQSVDLHDMSTDVASEGDVERAPVRAESALNGHAVEDITQAGSAESGETLRVVFQKVPHSEVRANGALVEDGSVGVIGHAKFGSDAAQEQGRTWEASNPLSGPWFFLGSTSANVIFFCSILLILPLCVCACFWLCSRATDDAAAANSWHVGRRGSFFGGHGKEASIPRSRMRATFVDGKVEAEDLWKQFDRDRSGMMERKELAALMGKLWKSKGIEKPLTNLMIDAMFARLDKDGEGTVSQKEFEVSFADLWEECVAKSMQWETAKTAESAKPTSCTYGTRRKQRNSDGETQPVLEERSRPGT